MVINNNIINLLNLRIKNEEQSSRIYRAMSSWLNLSGFIGASKLWNKYAQEELVHAQWATDYLLELNILPVTPYQEEPTLSFKGLPQIIAKSLQHELKITEECQQLASECLKNNDWLTLNLAQRYCKEQVEEISKMQTWVDKLNAFGDDKIALRLLDTEMGNI